MNYLLSSITFLVFFLCLVHAQAGGPLEVLRANGFTEFSDVVETEAPNTLSGIIRRDGIVIWAPVNGSPQPSLPLNNTTLNRHTPDGEDVAAVQMTIDDGAKYKKVRRE